MSRRLATLIDDNSIGLASPNPKEKLALLPSHIEGPWLLDYDDLEFKTMIGQSQFTELYYGIYRGEHNVVIKKLRIQGKYFGFYKLSLLVSPLTKLNQ